ncbi:MAG: Omp28 family outer membrane lipoprotein [Muribaculaceae bacterium]|nr:Omp28 family outer membrane lipoprotein [Muribaculaceae bacterium]
MMKHLLFSLLAIITLTACSDIDSDHRLVAVEGVTPARAVIIEDFTGQDCVKCPAAHDVLDQLVEQYPDNVIPVSIHAGHFGIAVENRRRIVGLMQPEGNDLCNRWGITAFPMGVVNGKAPALEMTSWATAVREQIALTTNIDIDLEATLQDGNVNITATLKPEADITATLHVWILESGIVAPQKKDGGVEIPDYVHNNVYRCSVNGIEGEAVELTSHIHSTLTFGQPVRTSERETWNTANLSVVAFLENTSGVIQAARTIVK